MPQETIKRVKMKPFQSGFMRSKSRFPAFVAGWGTAKTMMGIHKIFLLSQIYLNNLIMVCRNEYTDLRDSTIKDFEEYTGLKVGSNKDAIIKETGSTIMFRHGDEITEGFKPGGVLQNVNLGAFLYEQAEECETDGQFNALRGRLRRKLKVNPNFMITEKCKPKQKEMRDYYKWLIRQKDGFNQGMLLANTKGHNWIYKLWKILDLGEPPTDGEIKEMMRESGLLRHEILDAFDSKHYEIYEATSFDNKDNLRPDFIKDLLRMKKEAPRQYNRLVMNSWEDVDTEDKVIPYSAIMKAVNKPLMAIRQKTLISCDPKEYGNDEGVIYGMVNGEIKRHKFITYLDPSEDVAGSIFATKCQIMRKEMKAQAIVLDNIGIGTSTRDFLSKMEEPVILADARLRPEKAGSLFGFYNLRAEMWWVARQAFMNEEVSIPDDPKLIEELAAPSFEITPRGYKIESKDKLRKADRLGHSPNRAECLVFNIWGQTQIDYDDEAVYPDDDYYPEETDIAESYSMRTAV